ncbi:hypothetical protein [Caballeronia sp. KNU42]
MPEPLQRLRRALLRETGDDRVVAKVLAPVPESAESRLDAGLIAAEMALEQPASIEHGVKVLPRIPV